MIYVLAKLWKFLEKSLGEGVNLLRKNCADEGERKSSYGIRNCFCGPTWA